MPYKISTHGFSPSPGKYLPRMVLIPNGEKHNELSVECSSPKEVVFNLQKYILGKLTTMIINPDYAVPHTAVSYKIYESYFDNGEEYVHRTDEDGTIDAYLVRDIIPTSPLAHRTSSLVPKIFNRGDYYVPDNCTGPATTRKVADTDTDIYIDDNPLRHQLIFLNSQGRWESASALTRESKSVKISRTLQRVSDDFKNNDRQFRFVGTATLEDVTLEMSSGYCTQECCEWWANEVLSAEYVWLREGNKLISVSLEPKEDVTSYNKANGQLGCVNFTLKYK